MKTSATRDGGVRLMASLTALALVLGACATASKDIATSYVSPLQFQQYDCDQLAAESSRIRGRVDALGGRLDTAASNDAKITGVGLILFWPALFFLGGTKDQEAEYARLKGEYEAVRQAAVQKKCTLVLQLPATAVAASAPAPAASTNGSR